jgi:hypothetical protein
MKLALLLLVFVSQVFASESLKPFKYLRQEVKSAEKEYQFNEYEAIIGGSLAFLVGNVGFYTTNSETLKLAYGGIQTVGIISVGQGVYDYYRPNTDQEMLNLLQQKKLTRSSLADGFITILGQEERAKRLALLYGSSLLVVQYAANAYLSDTPKDIKDIYLFLGGVNLIVAGHSYLSRGKYERYFDLKDQVAVAPILAPNLAGLRASYSF